MTLDANAVALPLTPTLGLDLNGRYIFMQKENSLEFPTEFNRDSWSASLGLASAGHGPR